METKKVPVEDVVKNANALVRVVRFFVGLFRRKKKK